MLVEMHAHTNLSSTCSSITPKEIIDGYKKAGYGAIVITDHFCPYYETLPRIKSWQDLCDMQVAGYLEAKKLGDEAGILVLYGCELRFRDTGDNDYLVYGIDNDFLVSNPDIFDWGVEKFMKYAKENGIAVFQAHPFRNGMKIVRPEFLMGIEVFNANRAPQNFERNIISELWADMHGLKKISGSDCHYKGDLCRGGVIFQNDITSMDDLLKELDNGNYSLIRQTTNEPSPF